MKITAKVILSVATAAAAGVAIGMLIAPEKGEELQKKITEGAKSWLGELSALLATGKSALEESKTSDTPQLEESNATRNLNQNV